jgi:phosphate transport system permease protein
VRKTPKITQAAAFGLLWLSALMTLGVLIVIVGYILMQGFHLISWKFLTTFPEDMGRAGGIFPFIVGTVYLTFLALLFAAPIGVGAAIYQVEYAKQGRFVRMLRFATENLAGVPSIIFGLFGFAFFVTFLKFKFSLLSGALTLALMILPTVIRTAEEALMAVPRSYREGSLALGATPWVTIYKVVLPAALPGIVTGIILGIGRAVGETAAVWLTAGGALNIPGSIMEPVRSMTLHLYILAAEGISLDRAFATATVLILGILLINTVANIILDKFTAHYSGERRKSFGH